MIGITTTAMTAAMVTAIAVYFGSSGNSESSVRGVIYKTTKKEKIEKQIEETPQDPIEVPKQTPPPKEEPEVINKPEEKTRTTTRRNSTTSKRTRST